MSEQSINVDAIIEALGGDVAAAEFFQITRQGVAKFRKEKRFPNARLLHLKAARPDLFHPQCRLDCGDAQPLDDARAA